MNPILIGVTFLFGLPALLIIAHADIIIFLLLLYVQWRVALLFAGILLALQALRSWRADIFDQDCTFFSTAYAREVQENLDDPGYVAHMAATHGQRWEEDYYTRRELALFGWLAASHDCALQPLILYSHDKQYRASLYHAWWREGLFEVNCFFVRYENIAMQVLDVVID
jgi:hypothetical protein